MYYLSIGNALKTTRMSQQLGHTKDGYVVYDHNVQKIRYPATMAAIIALVETHGEAMILREITMDVDVGLLQCIPTCSSDSVFYAKHRHEDRWSRFVRNKDPLPTKTVQVVLQKLGQNYQLLAFHYGPAIIAEPDQWDVIENEKDPLVALQNSIQFWAQHAWIEGTYDIDPETATEENVWQRG